MNRPLNTWLIFSGCLMLLLAAMAGVSVTTLRLDRAQMQAAQQAEVEENVRLALWRMDSLLTSIVVEESARPFSAWEPFASQPEAFTKGYTQIKEGEVFTPSPLLSYASSNVLVHFQLGSDGRLTSPQVPLRMEERTLALANYTTPERVAESTARLGELQSVLNQRSPAPQRAYVASAAPSLAPRRNEHVELLNREVLITTCTVSVTNNIAPVTVPQFVNFANAVEPPGQRSQVARNSAEWQARANYNEYAQQQAWNVNNGSYATNANRSSLSTRNARAPQSAPVLNKVPPPVTSRPAKPAKVAMPVPAQPTGAESVADIAGEGLFKPLWLGSELVLARRVNFPNRFVIQGAWLNWPALKPALLASVRDLFPAADLQPVRAPISDPHARLLAAVPAQLVTGAAAIAPLPAWTPARRALAVAWLCAALAAIAVAFLLHGTIALSERRASFVSAVTHELRTPLTTFKMYSEMLAEDMVPDATTRKNYLTTLCSEANRLGHLVENVLAYAQLERGSARRRVERVSLGELIERVKPRLEQRAGQAEMQVVVNSDDAALATVVHVDVSAVEQILFNLVDNACKYAAPTATEKFIHLEALPDGKCALLRVRDHGQGISAEGAKRLFQPFSKSAHEAAHSAPGVGLGLALCRRLSRSMGGDLQLDALVKNGACFVLTLPLGQTGAL